MFGGIVSTSPEFTTISLPSIQNLSDPSRMNASCSLGWLCSGTMHPFFSSTRASMTFCPTTKCRPSSGFKASTATESHEICRSSPLFALPTVPFSATLFFINRLDALRDELFFAVVFFPITDFFLVPVFAFFFIRIASTQKSCQLILQTFIQPAIHQNGLAGIVKTQFARQPYDGVRNLARFSQALKRGVCGPALKYFVLALVKHRRARLRQLS